MVAAIAGAHGIRGEVRLKLFTDDITRYRTLHAGGRVLTLVRAQPGANGTIARFAEVVDRTAAEGLRGTALTVPRSALPPLDEGEYYHIDVIGLPVIDRDGALLGAVETVEDFGAGDVIELRKPDGKTAMLPLRAPIAVIEDGRIVADPDFLA